MKRILFISALLLISLVGGVSAVHAQSGGNNTNVTESAPQANNDVVREINDNVVLRQIEYDFANETVIMVFDSERAEKVTITDALITEDRTEPLNRQQFTIDGRTVVNFNVRSYNRRIAITVDGGRLQPFMKSDSLFDFTNDYTSQQVIVGIIFGGFLGVGIVFTASYKREMEMTDEVEKIT